MDQKIKANQRIRDIKRAVDELEKRPKSEAAAIKAELKDKAQPIDYALLEKYILLKQSESRQVGNFFRFFTDTLPYVVQLPTSAIATKNTDDAEIDAQLAAEALTMAAKADAWGAPGLKPDNAFHYLTALLARRSAEGKISESQIQDLYVIVTTVRDRLPGLIQEQETALKRGLSEQEKMRLLYHIVEEEMGFRYAATSHLVDGVKAGELDCDTESYLVLAVCHEMAWPVYGVEAPSHFFLVWNDQKGTRFNMDLGGESFADGYYEQEYRYRRVLNSRRELVANFLIVEGANLEELNLAIKLDPRNVSAWQARASLNEVLGKTEEALRDLTHAATLDPESYSIFLHRGTLNRNAAQWEQDGPSKQAREEAAQWDLKLAYLRLSRESDPWASFESQDSEAWIKKIAGRLLTLALEKTEQEDSSAIVYNIEAANLLGELSPDAVNQVLQKIHDDNQSQDWLGNSDPEREAEINSAILGYASKKVAPYLGSYYYRKDEYDKARAYLEMVVEAHSEGISSVEELPLDLLPTIHILGQIYHTTKDFQGAEAAYTAALSLAPDEVKSTIQNGLGYLQIDRYELSNAESTFTTVLAQDPQNMDALLGLSQLYVVLGKHEQAESFAMKALALDPENVEARHDYATSLYSRKKYSEARDIYKKLYEEDPQNQNALLALGYAYEKLGDVMQAMECFSRITRKPLQLNAALGRAWVLLNEGKMDQAEEAFKALIGGDNGSACSKQIAPSTHRFEYSDALHGLGMVYAKRGKREEALDYLNRAQTWDRYSLEIQENIKKVENQPENCPIDTTRASSGLLN